MMKNLIKRSKGVSLISLVITVAVILILTNVVIYNAADSLKTTKLSNMQADIENLRDRVSTYYAQYGIIPADMSIVYTNTSHINSISEATDIGPFYVIDLAAMENITLYYGKDYERIQKGEATTQEQINQLTDLYIINGTSHNVFYVAGINSGDETFYTDYSADDADKVAIDLRYYDGVEIPDGYYYVGGTKDTGLVISDVQGDDLDNSKQGNQFVWIPVENEENYVRNTSYESYDGLNVSLNAYTDTGYLPEGIQPNNDSTDYNEEVERQAVMRAKGFFISRFEAGKEGDKLVSKKGATVWNKISQEDSKTRAKGFINNERVKSALCSGIQWDMIMAFVDGKEDGSSDADKTYNVIQAKASRHTGSPAKCGENLADRVCNIYDLEGNYWEYVAERNSYHMDYPVNGRGGDYLYSNQSAIRNGNIGDASDDASFRFVLYVIPRDNWSPSYDQTTTYTDVNQDIATIPEGFSVSRKANEKTIDDGLVVKAPDGSEFVWVPVDDINDMAQCSTAGGNCSLQLQDDGTLKCTTHDSEEIVGKLYASEQGENYGTPNVTYNEESVLKEPGVTGTNEDLEKNKEKYKAMAESVAKYKGFYVGRYELGLENGNVPVSKSAKENSNVTTANADESNLGTWYGLLDKCEEYSTLHSEYMVVSNMIWGSQYDAMMNWLQKEGKEIKSVCNYKENSSYVTGNTLNDIVNNIYDLYGCNFECTQEVCEGYGRSTRAGIALIDHSLITRNNYNIPNYYLRTANARICLYIK